MLGRVAVVAGLVLVIAACTGQPLIPSPSRASTPAEPASACLNGLSQATCDEAQKVALAAVASFGRTATRVWVNSGLFCPHPDCLFDPTQNFPYPPPPDGGTWVASVEIAFADTNEHAGLHIAQVGSNLVPVLIGYRVPLPGWCSGTCQ